MRSGNSFTRGGSIFSLGRFFLPFGVAASVTSDSPSEIGGRITCPYLVSQELQLLDVQVLEADRASQRAAAGLTRPFGVSRKRAHTEPGSTSQNSGHRPLARQ